MNPQPQPQQISIIATGSTEYLAVTLTGFLRKPMTIAFALAIIWFSGLGMPAICVEKVYGVHPSNVIASVCYTITGRHVIDGDAGSFIICFIKEGEFTWPIIPR